MHIREAHLADIPQLAEIRFAVTENVLRNRRLVTEADYADYLTRRGKGWVAEVAGRSVGFAIADLQGHSVWALFVQPGYDRQGIGRALHDTLLTWYFGQTQEPVWLSTAPSTRAEGFYRRAGWREVGQTASGEVKFEMEARKRNWMKAE